MEKTSSDLVIQLNSVYEAKMFKYKNLIKLAKKSVEKK